MFITGTSQVVPFPIGTDLGTDHGFILKFDAALTSLMAAQSLDYSPGDYGYQLAIDKSDRVIFGGVTYVYGTSTFKISDGTWRPDPYTHSVGMVMRWDNDLGESDFSTVVGGSWGADTILGMALDENDHIYLTGYTQTQDFPVDGFMTDCPGGGSSMACYEAFIVGLDPDISVTGADCLMDWAEQNYPSLFAPSGNLSKNISSFFYRYYSQSKVYLAVSYSDNHVYYLDAGNTLTDLGPLSSWLSPTGCQ